MKKSYKIEVDCANCANKMEDAARKTAGVKNAVVNFMMLKMNVEFEDGADPKEVMQVERSHAGRAGELQKSGRRLRDLLLRRAPGGAFFQAHQLNKCKNI